MIRNNEICYSFMYNPFLKVIMNNAMRLKKVSCPQAAEKLIFKCRVSIFCWRSSGLSPSLLLLVSPWRKNILMPHAGGYESSESILSWIMHNEKSNDCIHSRDKATPLILLHRIRRVCDSGSPVRGQIFTESLASPASRKAILKQSERRVGVARGAEKIIKVTPTLPRSPTG